VVRVAFDRERDWPDGPWKEEPDYAFWEDKQTGLSCMVRRNMQIGFLCGYVAVPKGHPRYGSHYESHYLPDDIHGGLTYSGLNPMERNDGLWWFGFDCGHFMDFMPLLHAKLLHLGLDKTGMEGMTYKTIGYVRKECRRLATQLSESA